MKKIILALTTAACALVCALGFVACSTDENEIESVSLDTTSVTLTVGDTWALTATVTPSDMADIALTWASSDPIVATVDDGTVTAVAEGVATITVTTNNGKTAECTVTVEADEGEYPPVRHTVTLYANGGEFEDGSDSLEEDVEDDVKIIIGITVTRGDKYVFTGWYKDEYCTEPWGDDDTVTDDLSLFAGWKYLNKYQSVIDALTDRIKTERNDNAADVEILSIFTDSDGCLCFVENDGTGTFSYKTDIDGYDEIAGNAEIIAAIGSAELTQLKAYNDTYTSDNNAYIADCMAYKYTPADNMGDAIVYSCVSEWEEYSEGKFATNGPWYVCRIKAIVADENGKVYDCSFGAVSSVTIFNAVIGGPALSEEVDMIATPLGDDADDFYVEYIKTKQA